MEIVECRARLSRESAFEVLKEARKLRKGFVRLSAIDFFPKATQQQADAALQELETAANQALSPDEPYPEPRTIERLDRADYQGRLWATRHRPWVDRQASAWPLHCDLCQRREQMMPQCILSKSPQLVRGRYA
jgi:hypothetical protein